MGFFRTTQLHPYSSTARRKKSESVGAEGSGSSGIHGSEEVTLPMGHIPDYAKASDGELNAEISHCRSILALIEHLERDLIFNEDVHHQNRADMKDRLTAAEQELERRFLLS
jgi:hypothetical protein